MQLADYRKKEIIMLNTGEKLTAFDETMFKNPVHEIKVTTKRDRKKL